METVKGFKDFLGKDAEKFAFIREIARQTFEKYNFQEVQTPVVEYEKFVKGDNTNDEAVSDIFRLQDKGKRELALRYEFTFQLKRIAINQKLPFKRFQIGPVFRDEPVSENRVRQLTQCDIDTIGATIKDEAEILAVIKEVLDALKIKSVIYVNNRKLLNEILEEQGVKEKEQVIREIDKLDKLSSEEINKNLQQYNAQDVLKIFQKPEEYFKKYKAYQEIEELKRYCKLYGFEIKFQPSLARGLSYYTGNVFEVKSTIKETICGGGTYLIGENVSSGISFSIERLMAVVNLLMKIDKTLIVSLNQDEKAISLSKQLRKKDQNTSVYFGKPSKALEYANSYGFNQVIFVGEKEVEQKKFKIKNLTTGKEVTLIIEKKKKN
jgi:histidyl-tRNA synthetase